MMSEYASLKEMPVKSQKLIAKYVFKAIEREVKGYNISKVVNGYHEQLQELREVYPVKVKRALKKIVKDIMASYEDEDWMNHNSRVVNQWKKCDEENGEWVKYFFIVDASTKEDAKSIFLNSYIDCHPLHIYSAYDCTGRWFSNGMYFTQVGKDRWLCEKSYSLDV